MPYLAVAPQATLHQPVWPFPDDVDVVCARLATKPPIAHLTEVTRLRKELESVASGTVLVLQAGDCSEDPGETSAVLVSRKRAMLEQLSSTLEARAGVPVLTVGRIAGQFAKPRSNSHEVIDGLEVETYRGHMVNAPEPDAVARTPNIRRLLHCYEAAHSVSRQLGWGRAHRKGVPQNPDIWTSHEALVVSYEEPLLRRHLNGQRWLSSTHWPWVGDRTRHPDGFHVQMLASIVNPVASKIGPKATDEDVISLCEALDPQREPGRLTLISRLGAGLVRERLPHLVRAVRNAGHPVIWLCDPMHGNTKSRSSGHKVRLLGDMQSEIEGFHDVVTRGGGVAGGLHLEATADDVTECVGDPAQLGDPPERYTSLCDPRVDSGQAATLIGSWPQVGRS